MQQDERTLSGLDFFGEVSDLAAGLGMLVLPLAPFALPALALIMLAAGALLIPVVVGLVLAAPVLQARRWWRSRDRRPGDANVAGSGAAHPECDSAGPSGRPGGAHPAQLGQLTSGASGGAGEVSRRWASESG